MKEKSLSAKLAVLLATIFIFFILCHLSPQLAVRTKLFFSGHPVAALTSNVFREKENKDRTLIYRVESPPVEKATGTLLDQYRVEKQLFMLYFAKYHGV